MGVRHCPTRLGMPGRETWPLSLPTQPRQSRTLAGRSSVVWTTCAPARGSGNRRTPTALKTRLPVRVFHILVFSCAPRHGAVSHAAPTLAAALEVVAMVDALVPAALAAAGAQD